jgi:RimJ/RimL family protein N-acetyltransferase
MILVSHNVYLSPVSANDADAVVECMRDKEIYNNTMRIPFPYSYEDARLWLEDSIIFEEENGFNRNFAIRNETGKMMGVIGFHFNYGVRAEKSEIGYWLGKAYWNRGNMTSVVKKFCAIAKEQYDMKILEAYVFDFNNPSQKVLLKAGFTEKERLPKWFKKDGQKVDAVKFVMLL